MTKKLRVRLVGLASLLTAILLVFLFIGFENKAKRGASADQPSYEYEETRQLVSLVNDAAQLVQTKGEAVFAEFRVNGSRWRQGETYIFVLDPQGEMLVHPDPELDGKNMLELKDINGRPIIRGLIEAATAVPNKPEGWYHYEWPVPGGLLPRWKSTYVRLVTAPSGSDADIVIFDPQKEVTISARTQSDSRASGVSINKTKSLSTISSTIRDWTGAPASIWKMSRKGSYSCRRRYL